MFSAETMDNVEHRCVRTGFKAEKRGWRTFRDEAMQSLQPILLAFDDTE